MKLNFSDEPIIIQKNSIFLAGPTVRNSKYEASWRFEAGECLKELGYDGIVYNPEFGHSENPIDFVPQATWEKNGLVNAGCIVFYVCREFPDIPGLTTNVEFGRYLTLRPDNCLLCCPEFANKNRYLKWLYNDVKPGAVIYETMEDVLKAAIEVAHKHASE